VESLAGRGERTENVDESVELKKGKKKLLGQKTAREVLLPVAMGGKGLEKVLIQIQKFRTG